MQNKMVVVVVVVVVVVIFVPGASKFCSWAFQMKMEVWWSSGQIKLASVFLSVDKA